METQTGTKKKSAIHEKCKTQQGKKVISMI